MFLVSHLCNMYTHLFCFTSYETIASMGIDVVH